jgi:hypothetical protein
MEDLSWVPQVSDMDQLRLYVSADIRDLAQQCPATHAIFVLLAIFAAHKAAAAPAIYKSILRLYMERGLAVQPLYLALFRLLFASSPSIPADPLVDLLHSRLTVHPETIRPADAEFIAWLLKGGAKFKPSTLIHVGSILSSTLFDSRVPFAACAPMVDYWRKLLATAASADVHDKAVADFCFRLFSDPRLPVDFLRRFLTLVRNASYDSSSGTGALQRAWKHMQQAFEVWTEDASHITEKEVTIGREFFQKNLRKEKERADAAAKQPIVPVEKTSPAQKSPNAQAPQQPSSDSKVQARQRSKSPEQSHTPPRQPAPKEAATKEQQAQLAAQLPPRPTPPRHSSQPTQSQSQPQSQSPSRAQSQLMVQSQQQQSYGQSNRWNGNPSNETPEAQAMRLRREEEIERIRQKREQKAREKELEEVARREKQERVRRTLERQRAGWGSESSLKPQPASSSAPGSPGDKEAKRPANDESGLVVETGSLSPGSGPSPQRPSKSQPSSNPRSTNLKARRESKMNAKMCAAIFEESIWPSFEKSLAKKAKQPRRSKSLGVSSTSPNSSSRGDVSDDHATDEESRMASIFAQYPRERRSTAVFALQIVEGLIDDVASGKAKERMEARRREKEAKRLRDEERRREVERTHKISEKAEKERLEKEKKDKERKEEEVRRKKEEERLHKLKLEQEKEEARRKKQELQERMDKLRTEKQKDEEKRAKEEEEEKERKRLAEEQRKKKEEDYRKEQREKLKEYKEKEKATSPKESSAPVSQSPSKANAKQQKPEEKNVKSPQANKAAPKDKKASESTPKKNGTKASSETPKADKSPGPQASDAPTLVIEEPPKEREVQPESQHAPQPEPEAHAADVQQPEPQPEPVTVPAQHAPEPVRAAAEEQKQPDVAPAEVKESVPAPVEETPQEPSQEEPRPESATRQAKIISPSGEEENWSISEPAGQQNGAATLA